MVRKFIVTGGAGFIGSNLVKALNLRGEHDIVVVDHLNHPAKERNLNGLEYTAFIDKSVFRARLRADEVVPVNGVFHLGACSSTLETNEEYLTENNFRYSVDLCKWSLGTGARFIYASSAATYGDGSCGYSDNDNVTRTLRPLNAYGRSKQRFDLWAMNNRLLDRIVGLKYFNVYGPGEDHKGEMRSLVNKAFPQVMTGGGMKLFRSHRPDCRHGEQARDFVFVHDAVAVTLHFLNHSESNGLFNCGTGHARRWVDLAKALFAACGRTPLIEFVDMPESIRTRYQYHTEADIAKLRAAGYEPPFLSIEEGIRRYVTEYLTLSSHSSRSVSHREGTC